MARTLQRLSDMNATTTETQAADKLETETCTRCHGSGHYSQCQQYGTRCFRCAGKCITLTKRGEAAKRYLTALRSKLASDIVIGDSIWLHEFFSGKTEWYVVDGITPHDNTGSYSIIGGVKIPGRTDLLDFSAVSAKGEAYGKNGVAPEEMIRVRQTPEQSAETFAKALAYQATLTKTGTPRKR